MPGGIGHCRGALVPHAGSGSEFEFNAPGLKPTPSHRIWRLGQETDHD